MCSICDQDLVAKMSSAKPNLNNVLTIPECMHMFHSGCFVKWVSDGNLTCKTCNKSLVDEHTLKNVCTRAKLSEELISGERAINRLHVEIEKNVHENVVYLRQWIMRYHFGALISSWLLSIVLFTFTDNMVNSYMFVLYFLTVCFCACTYINVGVLELLIKKLEA